MLLCQTFQNIDFPDDQWGFQILQVKITWAGLCLKCSSEGEHTAFYRKELAHDCDDIQSAHVWRKWYVMQRSQSEFSKAMQNLLLERTEKCYCLEESPLTDGI